MPPMSPQKTIISSSWPLLTISSGFGAPDEVCSLTTALVTVSATSTDRNAPTRLRMAESATAVFGFRAPVAMEVAMALAVS